MYSEWLLLLGAVLIWLGILTYFIWRQFNFLKSLFPKSGERDIRIKFAEVVKTVTESKGELIKLESKLSQIEKQGLTHIQRVELLRYNPYGDTGGDISFSAALLDRQGSGVVVTSLHARSQTRVFAKPVIKGKAEDYQFSQEEQAVIKKAINLKNE